MIKSLDCLAKRDFTIEKQSPYNYKAMTIGGKSLLFIMIGWDPWIKERVNYLSCMLGEGGIKDICCIS